MKQINKKFKSKIKLIIFFLNIKKLSDYQKQVMIDIEKNKKIKVIKIFEIPEKKRSLINLKIFNKILLKIVLFIEKHFFIKEKNDKSKLINFVLNDKIVVRITPIRKKYVDRFNEIDTNMIDKFKPDIILNFTDRLLKGKILNIAKYGMWGFHYSDTSFQRNGLGGFYEIIEKKNFSCITLQRYNEHVDGGKIINKKCYKTLKYFITNHSNLLNSTSLTFQESVKKLILNKIKFIDPPKYKKKLYAHPPSIRDIFKYIFFTYFKKIN